MVSSELLMVIAKLLQLHRRCTERADKEERKAVEVSDMFVVQGNRNTF